MTTWNQTFAYTIYVSKIGIKTICWGILFPIPDIKSKAVIRKSHNPISIGGFKTQTLITMINAYGQYTIFGCSFGSRCLLRLTRLLNYLLILTYRLFTFWNIKILFFLLQNRSFFDVIRKYPEIINLNCFFMLFN